MSAERNAKTLRSLVVDHEWGVRTLLSKALAAEGFTCDIASTVEEAATAVSRQPYDLLVTDIIMPDRSGHGFVVEVLARQDRPMICVLTNVSEPRIAKDLLARGVDDLVFKPAPIPMLAAKLRSLVDRRLRAADHPAGVGSKNGPRGSHGSGRLEVSMEELQARLRVRPRIPAVSEAALAVYKLTNDEKSNSQQVAAAVQCEPALIADVLRLANSSFFNHSTQKITEVEQAVVRLGQKRVGEMALSTAAFAAASQQRLPFFSLNDTWRKCLATGICMELLLQPGHTTESVSGLFCTAVLQPMARILLAGTFPDIYERLVQQCQAEKKSLVELEKEVFPQRVGEIAAGILASWGIPDSICRPLRHSDLTFAELAMLPDSTRQRVELTKVAVFLGELVVGKFQSWDLLDLPSAAVLDGLGIVTVSDTIRQCQEDLKQIASFGVGAMAANKNADRRALTSSGLLAYMPLQHEPVDFVPHIMAGLGRRLVELDAAPEGTLLLTNALNVPVHHVVTELRHRRPEETAMLVRPEDADRLREFGRVIPIPCVFQRFVELLEPTTNTAATDKPVAVEA